MAALESVANDKIGEFVTRLLGRTLDSATNLKAALEEIRQVLDKIDEFKNKLFDTFSQAANSSYKVALHARYSRASEQDALVDVIIRPGHPRGAELLRHAGQGDFEEILTANDTDLVRLREGLFTHKARRERAFSVNIVGWHLNYQLLGVHKVITQTDQRSCHRRGRWHHRVHRADARRRSRNVSGSRRDARELPAARPGGVGEGGSRAETGTRPFSSIR